MGLEALPQLLVALLQASRLGQRSLKLQVALLQLLAALLKLLLHLLLALLQLLVALPQASILGQRNLQLPLQLAALAALLWRRRRLARSPACSRKARSGRWALGLIKLLLVGLAAVWKCMRPSLVHLAGSSRLLQAHAAADAVCAGHIRPAQTAHQAWQQDGAQASAARRA